MRPLPLLLCLLLAGCDWFSPLTAHKEPVMDPLNTVSARLAFTCKHENHPTPDANSALLFHYARWLQVNNQLKADAAVDTEVGRLYRIAAENDHSRATVNLLNGSLRGHFALTAGERLRFAQRLIAAGVASGYYFIAIYLEHGAAGLEPDPEMALRYYRRAADEGNPQAQAWVGEKLSWPKMAPDIARQMRRCAAEQGEDEAARYLGINFQSAKEYQQALEAFQLGVAAGDESAASFLEEGFNGPAPTDGLYYLGQQKDPERVRRYKLIGEVLGNYSYAQPKVPEINAIVPLPPAPLPQWDGTLSWLEARKANVQPPQPDEKLIAALAEARQLNPATGRPLPASADFERTGFDYRLLCNSGQPCPRSGWWQMQQQDNLLYGQREPRYFSEGDILPQGVLLYITSRPWPLEDRMTKKQTVVSWQFIGEA